MQKLFFEHSFLHEVTLTYNYNIMQKKVNVKEGGPFLPILIFVCY